eukprot:c39905_g1_i1 orf=1-594(-)
MRLPCLFSSGGVAVRSMWCQDRRWATSLLAGWKQKNYCMCAPYLFEEELLHQPSLEELACILYKYRKEGHQANALHLHALMCKSGLESCTSLGNHLVCMLVDFGDMLEAQQIFDRLVWRSERSWNSLITGYIRCEKPQNAFTLYYKMQEDDFAYPNAPTVGSLLKVCAKLKDFERGLKIHVDVARTGLLERDPYVGSA